MDTRPFSAYSSSNSCLTRSRKAKGTWRPYASSATTRYAAQQRGRLKQGHEARLGLRLLQMQVWHNGPNSKQHSPAPETRGPYSKLLPLASTIHSLKPLCSR